jgi:hypothetical protein
MKRPAKPGTRYLPEHREVSSENLLQTTLISKSNEIGRASCNSRPPGFGTGVSSTQNQDEKEGRPKVKLQDSRRCKSPQNSPQRAPAHTTQDTLEKVSNAKRGRVLSSNAVQRRPKRASAKATVSER